jgi:hypothetical protein
VVRQNELPVRVTVLYRDNRVIGRNVAQSPLARYCLSSGFMGKPIGTKSWVGMCKGQFEKTGVCRRQECARPSLRSFLVVKGGAGVGPHAGAETSCSA